MTIVLGMIGGLVVLLVAILVRQIEREQHYRRVLMRKLIDAQEDERKRIAYDLHDGLIQQLVGANMYFSMLRDQHDNDDLARGVEALSGAIAEGRRIIQGLHPTSLDDLGLEDAIAELSHQQSKLYGWELDLELEKLPSEPDRGVTLMVYRIVQEALNNIGKHANAKQVLVRLTNGKAIQLLIEDNGCGFEMAKVTGSSGLGIGTMCERALVMGGKCHVESEPQRGTRVTVKLPYHEGEMAS